MIRKVYLDELDVLGVAREEGLYVLWVIRFLLKITRGEATS